MNPFNYKTNRDDVFFRSLIIAFINTLNNEIRYDVIVNNNETREFSLNFYYSIVGDGRFIQDNFINNDNCKFDFADGNFDEIPRGTVNISSVEVREGELETNFVRGEYQKMVNGQMLTFSAEMLHVPLRVSFEVNMIVDTLLDHFKIMEVAFSKFFKSLPFSFFYKNILIASRAMMPAPLFGEKPYSYSYSDDQKIKMRFNVEVETHLPVINEKTEFFKGDSIQTFSSSQEIMKQTDQVKNDNPRLSFSSSISLSNMSVVFESYVNELTFLPGQSFVITNVDRTDDSIIVTSSGPASKNGNIITIPIIDNDDFIDIYPKISKYCINVIPNNDDHGFQLFKFTNSATPSTSGLISFDVDLPGTGPIPLTATSIKTITLNGIDFNNNDLTKWFKSPYLNESIFSKMLLLSNKTKKNSCMFKINNVTNILSSNDKVIKSELSVEFIGGTCDFSIDDLCEVKYGSDENFKVTVLEYWTNMPQDSGSQINLRLFKNVDTSKIHRKNKE